MELPLASSPDKRASNIIPLAFLVVWPWACGRVFLCVIASQQHEGLDATTELTFLQAHGAYAHAVSTIEVQAAAACMLQRRPGLHMPWHQDQLQQWTFLACSPSCVLNIRPRARCILNELIRLTRNACIMPIHSQPSWWSQASLAGGCPAGRAILPAQALAHQRRRCRFGTQNEPNQQAMR